MGVSIGCILASFKIMKSRNVALMAAYKVLEESFSKYRKRVVAKYGEEADAHFFYGDEDTANDVAVIHHEDGNQLTKLLNGSLLGFARESSEEIHDPHGAHSGSTQVSQ